MKILITGGNGYIAKSLSAAFRLKYDVTLVSREDFDLTAFEAMNDFFQGKYFDVVIHTAVQGGSRLKEETWKDADVNLVMYYNLLQHKPHYGKFLHFGSGAETYSPDSPYGLSKRVISNSLLQRENCFNLKIFGVFNETELETRFIKSSIVNYISKKPITIFENKKMTFFYMKDLITLVDHYVTSNSSSLSPECYCGYGTNLSLVEIADYINQLGDHIVDVLIGRNEATDYTTDRNAGYGLKYVGLKQGIQNVYNHLLHQHSA